VSRNRAQRYATWLDNNRVGLLVLSVLVAALAAYTALLLPIKSDLTNLLPSSQPSVRDLTALTARARPFGTVQIVVESEDVALRAKAGTALVARLSNLETEHPDLVTQFSPDEGPLHRYAYANRFLFADLADLGAARDGLEEQIREAKLKANPMYVPLDDEEEEGPSEAETELERIEHKLSELKAKAESPPPRVSADGKLQLIVIQTAFAASDAKHAKVLLGYVLREIDAVKRELGPSAPVTFGLTGNVTSAQHEHDSVLDGMTRSALITVILCALALLYYYRSGKVVLAMLWALAVGVLATFAVAKLAIGHLNVMTAFLAAIVVGNGLNAALIVVARYLEEMRAGIDPRAAIEPALRGALPGTLAATGTAAVAYASLMVTDFRGFRQFGAIAGTGMALTWITTFTVLPALLCVFARRGWLRPTRAPRVADAIARVMPARRRGWIATMIAGALITAAAGVVTGVYVAEDPFTHDWRDLQSSTPAIRAARALDLEVRAAFDPKALLSGQAFQVVIGVEKRAQVGPLVEMLRKADADLPTKDKWIHDVRSMDDLLPTEQKAKLEILEDIRKTLDDPKLKDALTDEELARLSILRPPKELREIFDEDVPHELAWPFIERDGKTIGRLVILRGSKLLDSFNVDHRLRFAAEVRKLQLPDGAVMAGESLVIADIIETMERDAPKMVTFALLGSVLAVFLVIGYRRHGLITIACGLAGVTVMIATCAIVGLKVHFLDLIALPITIGIGIDYAVNLTARDRQDGEKGPRHLIRTTGVSVLLCSYTTSVGYGTLMFSANGGIRAFGEAALIGELACIAMALVVAPAWLALARSGRGPGADRDPAQPTEAAKPEPSRPAA
jgi:uncharacterized protein